MSRETVRLPKTTEVRNELRARAEKVVSLSTEMEKATTTEDEDRLEMDLKIAQKEYEFYKWERDVTGAKKGDRFGVDLRDTLEEIGLGRNEAGELNIEQPEALDRHHLVLVNMGELDRLNSAGEHQLGDVGLEVTYNRIQEIVSQNLLRYIDGEDVVERISGMFEVYRVSGNDFAVVLKDVNAEIAKRITEDLQGNVEMPEEYGVEAVPLAANNISLRGSYEILESMRSVFGSEAVKEIDIDDAEKDDRTLFITLLRERLFTMNDFEKVGSRLERIIDKIRNPEGISAEDLYNDFLQKTLGTLFAKPGSDKALDFNEFKQALRDRGVKINSDKEDALDESDKEDAHDWEGHLFLTARDSSIGAFQDRYELKRKMELELQKQIISDLQKKADEKLIDVPEVAPASERTAIKVEYGSKQEQDVKEFEARMEGLGETEGQQILGELQAKYEALKDEGADEKEIKLAKLTLEVEKLKRDSATGLNQRGVLFGEMNERIESKKPISVISIDMAFLKFFDKEGGSKTGDNAILAAGKILDAVKRKYEDIGAEAYRVGGDEFVFTINVDDDELVQEVIQEIRETAINDVRRIPEYPGGSGRYKPEMLQFNFGARGYSEENNPGMANPDTLVHEADARVEADKAVNRFILLLQRQSEIYRIPEGDRADPQAELDVLYAYSSKSIFGEDGKKRIKELAKEFAGGVSLKNTTEEMIEFVTTRMKEKGKEDVERADLEHILLRNHLIIDMQQEEILKLNNQLEKAGADTNKDHDRIKALQGRLKEAEVDRDKVIQFRSELT
jgi:GGDEF domain-containing protein